MRMKTPWKKEPVIVTEADAMRLFKILGSGATAQQIRNAVNPEGGSVPLYKLGAAGFDVDALVAAGIVIEVSDDARECEPVPCIDVARAIIGDSGDNAGKIQAVVEFSKAPHLYPHIIASAEAGAENPATMAPHFAEAIDFNLEDIGPLVGLLTSRERIAVDFANFALQKIAATKYPKRKMSPEDALEVIHARDKMTFGLRWDLIEAHGPKDAALHFAIFREMQSPVRNFSERAANAYFKVFLA